MNKVKGIYISNERGYNAIWAHKEELLQVSALLDIEQRFFTPEEIKSNWSLLKDVEVILSAWGGPCIDEEFLSHAPDLKAIFYGAGSIRKITTDAMWNREIVITSSYAANAKPVAEFCLSQILFSLKGGWHSMNYIRENKCYPSKKPIYAGAYKSNVGVISLGIIGLKVLELLKPFDVNVLVYSSSLDKTKAKELGVTLCSLEEVFTLSDVITLHTANIPETRGMITGAHFDLMKEKSTFINTARGIIVKQDEMVEVLKRRTDITALLDVTYPEPPPKGDVIYDLPNIILTPHIAGALGNECKRLAQFALNDLKLWLSGKNPIWQITREQSKRMA